MGGIGHQGVGHRHGPVVGLCIQCIDLAAIARRLTQTLCEQRLVFANVRADHQHALQSGE